MRSTSCLVAALLALLLACWAIPGSVAANPAPPSTDPVLESDIRRHLNAAEGAYGVAVLNIKDGRTVMVNADTAFPIASMYKLLVAYRVLADVETGQLKMTDSVTITEEDRGFLDDLDDLAAGEQLTVADALHAMITRSDNSAAWALVRTVGGWDRVHAVAAETGMAVTTVDEQFWLRPAELLAFYYKLIGGSLLSRPAAETMLSLLLQQRINDRIPALLPPGTPVAHKTGELEDIRTDGGIVFGPGSAYIIVVMSHQGTVAGATRTEAELSRIVYDRYAE